VLFFYSILSYYFILSTAQKTINKKTEEKITKKCKRKLVEGWMAKANICEAINIIVG